MGSIPQYFFIGSGKKLKQSEIKVKKKSVQSGKKEQNVQPVSCKKQEEIISSLTDKISKIEQDIKNYEQAIKEKQLENVQLKNLLSQLKTELSNQNERIRLMLQETMKTEGSKTEKQLLDLQQELKIKSDKLLELEQKVNIVEQVSNSSFLNLLDQTFPTTDIAECDMMDVGRCNELAVELGKKNSQIKQLLSKMK